jgi:hypothetical protein
MCGSAYVPNHAQFRIAYPHVEFQTKTPGPFSKQKKKPAIKAGQNALAEFLKAPAS